MVSVSPRLRESLEFEDPEALDPRLSFGFGSLTLGTAEGYEHDDPVEDSRAWAGSPDPSAARRRRRKNVSDTALRKASPFRYMTAADGMAFRLCVLLPGSGKTPIECRLVWDSADVPSRDYVCLSYCWETVRREAAILLDGYHFAVTNNLLLALRNIRKPTMNVLIWIDQICINQDDNHERSHQVSIMKLIFSKAKEVLVWLGEADDRSEKVCEYARRLRRVESSPRHMLKRILGPRQLQDAVQKLLERPWFTRAWVLPEVALARFTTVVIGRSQLSWDNLVRLIRDAPTRVALGFDKHNSLLGNPRQKIAILTQMSASQRQGLLHTDITQLLILAKASRSTDPRDLVYSFYGVTLLSTIADYDCTIARLYVEIAYMYITSILWQDYYSHWHSLDELQRTQQLASILYSAGSLQQHYDLPSWVPDWTYSWHLAPIWCKTNSNLQSLGSKDEWSAGIRSDYRAGGENLSTFEVMPSASLPSRLRVSVYIFDQICSVDEVRPQTSTSADKPIEKGAEDDNDPELHIPSSLLYGRTVFQTSHGNFGVAVDGVAVGDQLAILLGGDVPVVLRRVPNTGDGFRLLCDCFVNSRATMMGDLLRDCWALKEDIVIV